MVCISLKTFMDIPKTEKRNKNNDAARNLCRRSICARFHTDTANAYAPFHAVLGLTLMINKVWVGLAINDCHKI